MTGKNTGGGNPPPPPGSSDESTFTARGALAMASNANEDKKARKFAEQKKYCMEQIGKISRSGVTKWVTNASFMKETLNWLRDRGFKVNESPTSHWVDVLWDASSQSSSSDDRNARRKPIVADGIIYGRSSITDAPPAYSSGGAGDVSK